MSNTPADTEAKTAILDAARRLVAALEANDDGAIIDALDDIETERAAWTGYPDEEAE